MQYIYVECAEGHRGKASIQLRGKTVKCPKCRSKVVIPKPDDRRVTDTSVMQILGDVAPLPKPPVGFGNNQPLNIRNCPRCSCEISSKLTVCPHCECYVGSGA